MPRPTLYTVFTSLQGAVVKGPYGYVCTKSDFCSAIDLATHMNTLLMIKQKELDALEKLREKFMHEVVAASRENIAMQIEINKLKKAVPIMKRYFLSVIECTVHNFKAISIQEDDGSGTCGSGYRIAGSKCCGSWNKKTDYTLSAAEWREVANRSAAIALEMESRLTTTEKDEERIENMRREIADYEREKGR